MNIIKTRLIRLSALSSLLGLTFLSLQSLELRYIELPAWHNGAIKAVQGVVDKANKMNTQLNNEILAVSSNAAKLNGALDEDEKKITTLQMDLLTSKGVASKAVADAVEAVVKETQAETDNAETVAAGQALIAIVNKTSMLKKDCVIVKKPPCMHQELSGKESSCDF
jgi:hypothetical protein